MTKAPVSLTPYRVPGRFLVCLKTSYKWSIGKLVNQTTTQIPDMLGDGQRNFKKGALVKNIRGVS